VRACHNCGYLVPDGWDTCKRCHAALTERVPTGVGARRATPYSAPGTRPVALLAPLPPPAPPPPLPAAPKPAPYDPGFSAPVRLGVPDAFPAAPPPAPPPSRAAEHTWSPPEPAGRSSSPWLRLLTAVVVVGLGLSGWQFVQSKLHAPPAAVQAYDHGDGPTYAPIGQGFSVRLPALPAESVRTVTVNGVPVTMHLALLQNEQWEAGVVMIDLPGPLPARNDEAAMRGAFAQGNSAIGGHIETQELTTHEGWPAMDGEITPPDGHPLLARIIVVNKRAYVLLAHAVNGTGSFFNTLVNSFHVVA
jgi:hypothetical protein